MSLQEEAEAIRAFIVQIMREPANAPGDVMGRLYAAFPGREELVRQVVNAFLARYARHANGSMLLVARPWRGIHSHIVINVPAIVLLFGQQPVRSAHLHWQALLQRLGAPCCGCRA